MAFHWSDTQELLNFVTRRGNVEKYGQERARKSNIVQSLSCKAEILKTSEVAEIQTINLHKE